MTVPIEQLIATLAVLVLFGAVVYLALRKERPDPFAQAMAGFDRRIAEARRRHQPVKHIEAERARFTTSALQGGRR